MSSAAWSLEELEVLRLFKRRMPMPDSAGNLSPFDARVATGVVGAIVEGDVPDLHFDARERIRTTIEAVRDGRKSSQVLLLAGAAGSGKTHLLNTFRNDEIQEQLSFVFVGGSNHWQIKDFEAQLLDWVIQALTAPSPNKDHPLLARIRAIGFRAVDHLLVNPIAWQPKLKRPSWAIRKLGWFGRRLSWFRRPSRETLSSRASSRNPRVFAYFDETEFGNYVCDRFLAEPSNLLHRYALRVMLCYLFPDRQEKGLSIRERVLHWFRSKPDNNFFTTRLGVDERPDRSYSQSDAVRLLAHLFSPAVSAELATPHHPCMPMVLLLTFDQAEGRDELFEHKDDWPKFFAQMSELYNTLPNVVVLFTMTEGLRNELHSKMERQFRDRIVMDDKMTLTAPTEKQLLTLYRNRILNWLQLDAELSAGYARLSNAFIPFTAEEVKRIAGNRSVRYALSELDTAFRKRLRNEIIVGARYDYLYARNEMKADEEKQTELDYTADTLSTISGLLDSIEIQIEELFDLKIKSREQARLDNVPFITFTFEKNDNPQKIVVHLARVGFVYNAPIDQLIKQLLYDKNKKRNFLKVVRPLPFNYQPAQAYSRQFTKDLCLVEMESSIRALNEIAQKADAYKVDASQWNEYLNLLNIEIRKTYFGKVLEMVSESFAARNSAPSQSDAVVVK